MYSKEKQLSGAARPRFSVLIPTRDRPDYARNALESVLMQSFGDFEVVICDNFKNKSCKPEVEAFNDPRVRYVTPPTPLAMHDNWEFAIDQARGDFVLILIDKTLLRHSALERLEAATQSHKADVYSWTADAYYLTQEANGDVGQGYLVPVRDAGEPFYVECGPEIAARVSFRERLGTEGPAYAYGKICFGAYSREIIARIKARFGKVCPLISPDYTSKTVALLSTDRMVDLNGSYTVSLMTSISNGMMFSQNSAHARAFLAQGGFTEKEFADLPIPQVFCSVHNICAYDWRMLGPDYIAKSLDMAALYVQVERDLEAIKQWASEAERQEILGQMRRFFETSPIALRERIVDEKRRMFEEHQASREKQITDREEWIKGREDFVKFREDSALARETAVLQREDAVIQRSQALDAESEALKTARYIGQKLRAARRLKRRVLSRSSPSSVQPANAPALEETTLQPVDVPEAAPPAEPERGYPTFTNTRAALEYAETELYQHPLPILPAGRTKPLEAALR